MIKLTQYNAVGKPIYVIPCIRVDGETITVAEHEDVVMPLIYAARGLQ